MMRAMLLEFPDDPACDTLDRQYMLGDALLVAPVFAEDGTVDYYLPAGPVDAPAHRRGARRAAAGIRAQHDFLSLPLFVRPGTDPPVRRRRRPAGL